MAHATVERSRTVVPLGHLEAPALGRLLVTDALCRELLTPLLAALREEPCAHSWQPLLARVAPAAAFDTVARAVAEGRPGRVFTYYRRTPSAHEALAFGVVSDAVARGFPAEGWPVVGRAFVHPAYRRQRLYTAVLGHRLGHCRRRWGQGLMAIHLGTASPGIERAFRRLHRGRVVYLGDEDLGEAGSVRALLGLTDALERGLRDDVPPALRREHAEVLDFLAAGATTTRVPAVATSLETLAGHHAGFRTLHRFLCHLPTLR